MLTTTTFEWVDLPEGPQPLPAWVKGAHVNWMDGYGSDPDLRLKTDCEAREWPAQTYRLHPGGRYTAEHEDGRSRSYYHHGKVSRTTLNRRRSDGAPGVEAYDAWATTCDDGLGGSHVHCHMAPGEVHGGEVVVLRGPWCSLPAPGYIGVVYKNTAGERCIYETGRPWYAGGVIAGLDISEDLFLRIVARYASNVRVARTLPYLSALPTLQLVHPDWDLPKSVASHRRIEAYNAARAAQAQAAGAPR